MRRVMRNVSNTALVASLVLGAIGSAVVFADRGAWFLAILAATMQLTCVAQWWLSQREGDAAARTADRFLALLLATLVVFYFFISTLDP